MNDTECLILCAVVALVAYQAGKGASAKAQPAQPQPQSASDWFSSWGGLNLYQGV